MKQPPEHLLAKKLKGPSQLERVRAARAMLDTKRGGSESMKMAAFLDIFHPDISDEQRLGLMQNARERDRTP